MVQRLTILLLLVLSLFKQILAQSPTPTPTADFVIIGAGTSGCVLAARLCAKLPNAKIVLLERASPRSDAAEFIVRSPRNYLDAWQSTLVSEKFTSLRNPGMNNRTDTIITGNTLGGSSAVNGMQWTVPVGNTVTGWNVAGLTTSVARTYYQRAFQQVGFRQPRTGLRHLHGDEWITAAVAAGFQNSFDSTSSTSRNAVWIEALATTADGKRRDSYTAYLEPLVRSTGACRSRLTLEQGALVSKLILEGASSAQRVVGVDYVVGTQTKSVRANAEVLVAAGPYGSPKLLQLSGIGQAAVLSGAGVTQKVELPVGAATQGRAINRVTSQYTAALEPANNSTLVNSATERMKWNRGENSVLGTAVTSVNGIFGDKAYIAVLNAFRGGLLDQKRIFSGCVANPTATGTLHITSSNPSTPPDVQLNLLGNAVDIERLQQCVEKMRTVTAAMPASVGLSDVAPSGTVTTAFLKSTSNFGLHFVGGCAVGTVLNSNLSVKNVAGVRVIDASALNKLPTSAGPLASTYMLAEYAAARLFCVYKSRFGGTGNCDSGITTTW